MKMKDNIEYPCSTRQLIKKAIREHKKVTRLIETGKLKEYRYENPKDFFKQLKI